MAASDARPVPRKNVAYRVTFPIFDADGDLVTGATGLDSEVSIDGAAFADCTNEATEIATSSGMYYLDLTQAEMNGDTVAVIVKTSSLDAKTTPIVFYPEEVGDFRADVVQISGDSTAADNAESFFDGTGYAGTNNVIPTVTSVTNQVTANVTAISGDTTAADNAEAFFDGTGYAGTGNTIPTVTSVTNQVTANVTAISGDTTAADNAELFFDGTGYAGGTTKLDVNVVGISGDTTAADNAEAFFDGTGYAGTNNVIPQVTTVTGNVNGSVASVGAGGITASTIATGAIDADALAADAGTEIAAAVTGATLSELSQGTPSATPTVAQAMMLLYMALRNKRDVTSTLDEIHNDAGTVICKATLSDDGSTFSRAKMVSGP